MSKKKGIILGAGTYGEVFLTYLTESGFNIVGFFDDNQDNIGKAINGVTILGSFNDLLTKESLKEIDQVFCPIGNNDIRTSYLDQLKKYGYETPNYIHSSVILNNDVIIGNGVYLLPGVIVMPHTIIEDFTIVSMGSRIAHHTLLKKGVFVSTGVNVGANIIINEKAFLGISSTIMTGVEQVGKNSIVGCGAVVIKNVLENHIVAGVPAKKLREREIGKNYSNYERKKEKGSLIVITKKEEWKSTLKEIGGFDFYHTYDYHAIEEKEKNNKNAILLKYTEDKIIIAIPLLVRKIHNTDYFDATSVYGYAGPISKGITPEFNNSNFQKKILQYFKENNFISVFSRLNPYILDQNKILFNIGDISAQGQVVNINLKNSIEKQRFGFQSRLKTHINKAKRHCSVRKASDDNDIQDFIDIYHGNMKRVNAKKSYYFSKEYFKSMATSEDFKSETLLAIDNESGETIAACQFIITNSIVQYHLSGTKNDFLHLTPTKLLINEMRLKATQKGLIYFNLGGGLGGRDDDTLFRFKSSYSKDFKTFNLWKLIIDPKVYKDLVIKKGINKNSNFFPLYRCLDDINIEK